MAATVHSRGPRRFAAMLWLALTPALAVAAGAPDARGTAGSPALVSPGEKITYTMKDLTFDYGKNHATMRMVTMSQGDLRVTADRADVMGLNSDQSRWTFTGNVHITAALRGDLQSDSAVVAISHGRIQSALASGHPAKFEQTSSKTGVLASGHADSIEYTIGTAIVRFTGNAWLSYGDSVISNPVLLYSIRDQKLEATSSQTPSERVHITIQPKRRAGAKPGAAPRPKP